MARRFIVIVKMVMGLQRKARTIKSEHPDHYNADVQEILALLGPFPYGFPKEVKGVIRIAKPATILPNKCKYDGQWNEKTGQKDGMGMLIWPDGTLYEGFWKNDRQNGFGRMIRTDRDAYTGEWLDDQAQGKGTFMSADGTRYNGDWN